MSLQQLVVPALCTALSLGCTATTESGGTEVLESSGLHNRTLVEATDEGGSSPSRLAVEIRDINVVGRTLRLRGRVTSPYQEDVEGVICRLRLVSTDGERTLRTEYEEIDTLVRPGAVEPFQVELQSMYFATVPRFIVDAIPVKLGAIPFPAPSDWER